MRTLPPEYYTALWDLQSVDFVLVELTLYLDTHPGDVTALDQFNRCAARRLQVKQEFEANFHPLQEFGNSLATAPWSWAESPWPWEV